jgi:hypothetical protein
MNKKERLRRTMLNAKRVVLAESTDVMADLIKISIQGAMPGGEVWSINPVWRINASPQTITAAEAQSIVNLVNSLTIPTGVLTMFSSATTVTGCRVEARTNAGVLEALAEGTRAVAVNGTGSTSHPYQTSAVVSLRSPLAGGSGRGRLYFPATGVSLAGSSLRPAAASITSHLSGVKTYLSNIQTIAVVPTQPDCILAVWSRKLATTLGVTRLQMGDVLDVQRRRRDAAIENYQELAFP